MFSGKRISDGEIVYGSLLEASDGTFIISENIKVYNEPRLIEGEYYIDEVYSESVECTSPRLYKWVEEKIDEFMESLEDGDMKDYPQELVEKAREIVKNNPLLFNKLFNGVN